MLGDNKHREAPQSVFMSSVKGLANTGAVVATFFAVPPLYSGTAGWIEAYTARHYGPEFTELTSLAWYGLIALLTFFVARASLSTLLVIGGLTIATRFF